MLHFRHWGRLGGSGSVVSNAVDMSKYLKFHLSGGSNEDGETVVSQQVTSIKKSRKTVM